MSDIRKMLIVAGVKNLQTYGYPHVSSENIVTDKIYSAFFASMLRDNLGKGFDKEVNALIKEIEGSAHD
jgi:hypothetical protein